MTATEQPLTATAPLDTTALTDRLEADLLALRDASEAESGRSLSDARRGYYAFALWARDSGLLDELLLAAKYLRDEQTASPLEMAERFSDPALPDLAELRVA